ncbi:MAG TPA: 3-phosphoshikimate 1-carboxyvinyltransferase [Gemmatimonadales bacterium]|jgi:3-phosphoshikimate 1-carboxyvinyltransferase|nr:3-phosphoshikimate 1-carboxyvinyltransferase [Gemmatimonadales bacterium]
MPKSRVVGGTHRVPGDKSITHRALLFAALAPGRSTVTGALTSLDARSTARVLRQLGAEVSPLRQGTPVEIRGRKRLVRSDTALDCGNSGTTARLLLGLLAAQRFSSRVTGDASLRRRPMRRVTDPLVAMGARVTAGANDGLPLTITGGALQALDWELAVASAQVKSALLLAGAAGGVEVRLTERAATRDHTERFLRHFGFDITVRRGVLTLKPTGQFAPFDITVPGDPSSAIFLLAATLLADRGDVRIAGVGLNPSRTGFLAVLRRMGAVIDEANVTESFGEPLGDLITQPAMLVSTDIAADEVPGVIDEIPMLACLAARARGTSRFVGLAELRVKESNRLELLATNLQRLGANARVDGDDLIIAGRDAPLAGRVVTHADHRIAMAFTVLGRVAGNRIRVDDPACAAVSFPGFDVALAALDQGTR